MATDLAGLLPIDVSSELITMAANKSAVMALARKVMMPASAIAIPVSGTTPTAKFVNSYGQGLPDASDPGLANGIQTRKPAGPIEWTALKAVAEEIAIVTWVPDAFVADMNFDVWGEVKERLAGEIARTFDAAALYGTGAPPTYPVGGLVAAAGTAVTALGDDYGTINEAWGQVEDRFGTPNGVITGPNRRALRDLRDGNGRPLLSTDANRPMPNDVWGVPLTTSQAWNPATGDFLVGDWNYAIVGIRQDITWDTSTDGVVVDGTGAVTVSAFQDDVTLIRMYMRVAFAIGKTGANAPFALGDFTTE